MKNTMLPQAELEKVQEIIKKVEELKEVHMNSKPNVNVQDDLMQLHTVAYMDVLKEFLQSASLLKGFMELTEEEFKNAITDDGKVTIQQAKQAMMIKMITEMIFN